MVIFFFILVLICGGLLGVVSALTFVNARDEEEFLGISIEDPRHAIVGIVVGVLIILSGLLIFLPMNSSVSALNEDVGRNKNKITGLQEQIARHKKDAVSLTKERDDLLSKVALAETDIKALKNKLEQRQDPDEALVQENKRLTESLKTTKERLDAKGKEADSLSSDLGIVKTRLEVSDKEIGKLKAEIDKERRFRRDFKALVEEEEAAPSGTVLKLFFKLQDLLKKYK